MIKLDERDLQILTVLQQDGRISKKALADKVALSPTACWERLKRLEQTGIIEGYEARLSLVNLGAPSIIFMQIEIANHRAEDFKVFETAVSTIDQIVECWAIGGGIDYFLKIVCPTIDTYQQLVDDMLQADIGLKRYYTYIVTKPIKFSPTPPLSILSV